MGDTGQTAGPHALSFAKEQDACLRAVIFDVDGTLAQTEQGGHRLAFNQAFAEAGLPWQWSPETYAELLAVTGGKERLRAYVGTHDPQRLESAGFGAWLARLHQRKSEIYAELVRSGAIALRPGVARLIDELRAAGVRLAIATTTTRSSLDSLICTHFACDTDEIFAVVGAGDVVAAKKPAPDVYFWVLEQLHLAAQDCLAIEDSEPGLRAAQAAGIPTLVTLCDERATDDLCGALGVVSDLGEPDAPARRIAGLPLTGACVDLAQLRAWHLAAMNGAGAGAGATAPSGNTD